MSTYEYLLMAEAAENQDPMFPPIVVKVCGLPRVDHGNEDTRDSDAKEPGPQWPGSFASAETHGRGNRRSSYARVHGVPDKH